MTDRSTIADVDGDARIAGSRLDLWLPRAIGGIVVLLSALLLAMLWFVHRTVDGASAALVQGQGIGLAESIHRQLRGLGRRADAADLTALLADESSNGLRYVALLRPDAEQVLAEAGTPSEPLDATALRALAPLQPTAVGGRYRLLAGPPLERPPLGEGPGGEAARPDGGGAAGGPGERPGRPPGRRADGDVDERRPPPMEDGAGPPPGHPPHGPPVRIVLEFEPVVAESLAALSRRMLWIGVVALVPFVGGGVLLVALVRQRDELMRRLAHGQKLAALGEMSAVIAHELRNPLASLKGHAQLLQRSLEAAGPKAKADLVVREAVRLQALLGDLLDFAKADALVPRASDPGALLREAADAVDPLRIEIDAVRAPALWRLDPGTVRQALVNLLRNAIQASPDGAPVRAAAYGEDARLVFEVRDRGPGIPPGDEERIFEPFVTGKARGTGLGLSLVRRIARQHGGAATARNAEDGGAVFRLTLAQI